MSDMDIKGGNLNVLLPVIATFLDSALLYGFQKTVIVGLSEELIVWLRFMSRKTDEVQPRETVPEYLEEYRQVVGAESPGNRQGFFSNKYRILDSTFELGGSVGAIVSIVYAKKFGRRGGLLMTAFINFFGALFSGYSKYFELPSFLYIGRLLLGFKCGVNSVIAPIYVGEIVPLQARPKYLTLYSLVISLGGLFANLLHFTDNTRLWPLVISSSVIPAIIVLIVLPVCPESPQYLYIIKGKEIECKKALKWLRGDFPVDEELSLIRKEFYQYQSLGDITFKMLLEYKILRQAMVVVVVLMMSQELTGTAGVLLYYNYFNKNRKAFYKVGTYITLLVVAIIASLTCEYFSRKGVLKWTFILMSIACVLMSISLSVEMTKVEDTVERSEHYEELYCHIPVAIHLIAFKMGIGSLVWLLPTEYFSCATIHYAYSLGSFMCWLVKFLTIIFYMPLQDFLGYIGFLNYALVNVGCAYFVHLVVFDTRGKTVKEVYEEIYKQMKLKGVMY